MKINQRRGALTTEELREIAVGALVREWGITEAEARAAIERNITRERRLTREVACGQVWAPYPDDPIPVVDLTEPVEVVA